MAVSVSEKRTRQSLRLDLHVWEDIDRDRDKRPGNVSRNTWITEAILEKLSRKRIENEPRRAANA
jgi:hypothetical protein